MRIKGPFHSRIIIFIAAISLSLSLSYVMSSKAFALSIEEERVLGQEFLAKIRQHFEIVDDDFVNQFMNDMGNYLIKPIKTEYFPFHFYTIKDNTLNAFAGPGGHIFIFSGLIEVMDNFDELAAVICHEIGHVSARHLAQRLEQNKKIALATMAGILAGVFIGGKAAEPMITGSVAAGIQTQLHYSRNDERQADQLGFKYMKSAGFDPAGMISVLKKIEKQSLLGSDEAPAYLLTHPTGPERMSNLDIMLSQYSSGPPKKEAEQFSALFPYFKTIVRAKCLDAHEARRLFDFELKKSPASPIFNFGLGLVYKEELKYAQAIHYIKKASELKPNFIPILTNLGEAYQLNGQNEEAISVLEDALELDGGSKLALFLLGLSYENLEQFEKSAQLFERLASLKPVKNEVYYHLGISYGRQNRLALAHYNFGLYFKKLEKAQEARFHFQKAEALSHDNPDLRIKIREAMEGKL